MGLKYILLAITALVKVLLRLRRCVLNDATSYEKCLTSKEMLVTPSVINCYISFAPSPNLSNRSSKLALAVHLVRIGFVAAILYLYLE